MNRKPRIFDIQAIDVRFHRFFFCCVGDFSLAPKAWAIRNRPPGPSGGCCCSDADQSPSTVSPWSGASLVRPQPLAIGTPDSPDPPHQTALVSDVERIFHFCPIRTWDRMASAWNQPKKNWKYFLIACVLCFYLEIDWIWKKKKRSPFEGKMEIFNSIKDRAMTTFRG